MAKRDTHKSYDILTDLGMCAATEMGRAVNDLSEESGRRDSLPSDSSSSSEEDFFRGPHIAPIKRK